MKYNAEVLERLFTDLGILYMQKGEQFLLVSDTGQLVDISSDRNEVLTDKVEPVNVSRGQWCTLSQVQKRLIAGGLDFDSGVDNLGRWRLRLEPGIDFVFSKGSEMFTKLEITGESDE